MSLSTNSQIRQDPGSCRICESRFQKLGKPGWILPKVPKSCQILGNVFLWFWGIEESMESLISSPKILLSFQMFFSIGGGFSSRARNGMGCLLIHGCFSFQLSARSYMLLTSHVVAKILVQDLPSLKCLHIKRWLRPRSSIYSLRRGRDPWSECFLKLLIFFGDICAHAWSCFGFFLMVFLYYFDYA